MNSQEQTNQNYPENEQKDATQSEGPNLYLLYALLALALIAAMVLAAAIVRPFYLLR